MYNEVQVFAENKSGKLAKVASVLGNAGINIINFQIADVGQFGAFKILTADPDKTAQVLRDAGMVVALNPVTVVEIADKPGALVALGNALTEAGVNVLDAYGCLLEKGDRAIFVVHGDKADLAEKAAKSAGFTTLSEL